MYYINIRVSILQMAPVVEIVCEKVTLGEGPHWDAAQQCLYFVDILGQAILKYVPATNKTTKATIGKHLFSVKYYLFTTFL